MNIASSNEPVAANISRIIAEKGFKRKSIAEKAGYSEQTLSDMLNGRKVIRIRDVTRLHEALEVSYNDLFESNID